MWGIGWSWWQCQHRSTTHYKLPLCRWHCRKWIKRDACFKGYADVMRMLILSIFLCASESWTLTPELDIRIQALETRCYKISYKCHVSNEEVSSRILSAIAWWTPNHGDQTETQVVWPHHKILWHGEDNPAADSERSKNDRQTEEEMGR